MAKRKNKKQTSQGRYRGFWPALTLLALAGAVLALVYVLPAPKSVSHQARPPFENFKHHAPPSSPAPKKETQARPPVFHGPGRPMVAIIIDDMGYDFSIDEAFLQLEAPISYAFLPFAPNTKRLSCTAAEKGRDVLVHLPLEPENGSIDPGPGVLRLDMDFNTTLETLKRDIDAVPCAIGVNNHMGSKYTANGKAMKIILGEIRRRGMFFVDSRTTKKTVAFKVAKQMGLRAGERAVFLDHTQDARAVKSELKRLVSIAYHKGSAIAIGHPFKVTLQVLYHELPALRKQVRVVPVHVLLKKEDAQQ